MKYICTVCDFIYDPEIGDPEGGIEPGTQFEDIPDDWVCPLCGSWKEDFEPYNRLNDSLTMNDKHEHSQLHALSFYRFITFLKYAFFSFTSLLASTTFTT